MRAKRKPKLIVKPTVDYGRRVRNVLDGGKLCVVPVLPHTGPKPVEYPALDYTPRSWRRESNDI